MASMVAVAQSSSGEIPESEIDALNSDGEFIEMELAGQIVACHYLWSVQTALVLDS